MSHVRIAITPGGTGCTVDEVDAFPGASFIMSFPESIGDAEHVVHFPSTQADWRHGKDGELITRCLVPGELEYTIHFTPGPDYVDARTSIVNKSTRHWAHSLAFNCVHPGSCEQVIDHECLRHYTGYDGRPTLLRTLPRVFGPRPVVQLYNIEGMPPADSTRFVNDFHATPDITVENWLAIASLSSRSLMAVTSHPALFLFHNLEYSCIHAAQSLGALKPGQRGQALTRAYFTEMPLEDWYVRMKAEFA